MPIAVKIAIEMKVIEHIVKAGGPITSDKLAELSGAEELLIS